MTKQTPPKQAAPSQTASHALSRRERQIMDILYRRGRATAAEVNEDLSGEPHYSTVHKPRGTP